MIYKFVVLMLFSSVVLGQPLYVVVDVESVTPIVEIISTSVPQEKCHVNQVLVNPSPPPQQSTPSTSTIIGGVIGSLIGAHVGAKKHRPVGIAVGGAVGSALGNTYHQKRLRSTRPYYKTERYCETISINVDKEVVSGYNVTYSYEGKQDTLVMKKHPGDKLTLKVTFTPVLEQE